MLRFVLWSAAVAYAVRASFSSGLFHRVWSLSILSFLGLVEATLRQEAWTEALICGLLAALSLAVCVVLSPAQVFLFPTSARQHFKAADVWLPKNSADVDIVAVHGLGSKAETAWAYGADKLNWLRDLLPREDGLNARVIAFYHNSQWESQAFALSIDDMGRALLDVESEQKSRPIIFIGYSFGGIIVKKALVMNIIEPVVRSELIGCFFLGTPHHGSAFTTAGKLLSLLQHWSGSSIRLLQAIERESPQNETLHTEFTQGCSDFGKRIVNCFETVPEYLGPFPLTQVVSRADARLDIGTQVTIDYNHRDLRRLEERNDYYDHLLGYLKSLLDEVQRPLLRKYEEDRKQQYDALINIPHALGAAFDDRDQQANPCTKGTRSELLEAIYEWAENREAKTGYWLSGMAGTGKSTIALTVAQELQRKGFVVGSFFFRRGAGDRGGAVKFVSTILRQLATHPNLRSILVDAWNKNPGIIDKVLYTQWNCLLKEPLANFRQDPIILIIDAVDESEVRGEGRNEMLDFLCDESNFQNLNLRLFVTSRPQKNGVPDNYETLNLHDINKNTVEEDIKKFLADKFRDVTFEGCPFPTLEHIEALAKRSTPLFIAAMTSYRFIIADEHDIESRYNLLMEQTQGLRGQASLDEMYLVVIAQVLFPSQRENATGIMETNIRRYQLLVGSLMILQDALSVRELAFLLGENPHMVGSFLKAFGAVLEIPESPSPVRLFHQSFRDFLLDQRRVEDACKGQTDGVGVASRDVWIEAKKTHTRLFHHCLDLMEGVKGESNNRSKPTPLKADICNLKAPGAMAAHIGNDRLKENIPPQLEYACKYWVSHFIAGETESKDCHSRLWKFLQQHLLHWIEAMSCLGIISRAIGQIDQLYQAAEHFDQQNHEILLFVADARRFIRNSDAAIAQAPLQVYCSALVFAPEVSKVKQRFATKIPSWIRTRSKIDGNWSAKLLHFDAHSKPIYRLKSSTDGGMIASLSSDGSLFVWETATGSILLSLPQFRESFDQDRVDIPEDYDWSAANLLAFRNDTGAVSLWHAEEKRLVKKLSGRHEHVAQILFAPNGKLLAAAYQVGHVTLWDPYQGCHLYTLEVKRAVSAMAFSSDSKTIAVGCESGLVVVWHNASEKATEWHVQYQYSTNLELVHRICIISEERLLISFGPLWGRRRPLFELDIIHREGQSLASYKRFYVRKFFYLPGLDCVLVKNDYQSRLVSINETAEPLPFQEFEGLNNERIFDMAVSSNGTLLAGTTRSKLKIWDTADGSLRATMDIQELGHVAFLQNDTVIAVSSHLFDVKTILSENRNYATGYRSGKRITVSPDGKLAAQAKTTNVSTITITMYDLEIGSIKRARKGSIKEQSFDIYYDVKVKFSPDSRFLVVTTNNIHEFWDLHFEQQDGPFYVRDDLGEHVAFSEDGSLVAFFDEEKMTLLLEAASWKEVDHYQLRWPSPPHRPGLLTYGGKGFAVILGKKISDKTFGGFDYSLHRIDDEKAQVLEGHRTPNSRIITEAACSPASRLIAIKCLSFFGKDLIWLFDDNKTLEPRQSLAPPFEPYPRAFCSKGQCLLFDCGNLPLPRSLFPDSGNACTCDRLPAVMEGNWLFWRGKPILWFPPHLVWRNVQPRVARNRVVLSPTCCITLGPELEGLVRDQPVHDKFRDWFEGRPADVDEDKISLSESEDVSLSESQDASRPGRKIQCSRAWTRHSQRSRVKRSRATRRMLATQRTWRWHKFRSKKRIMGTDLLMRDDKVEPASGGAIEQLP